MPLTVTRKINEEIHIGDNIKIRVVKIQGQKVRIAVEAPQDIRITRPEAGKRAA